MAEGGRVIAGRARGARLRAPAGATRPLADRVKQSLFGALVAAEVVGEGRSFLDLFAGSGAAGIEALSLGCQRATFVERDAGACAVIDENLARSGLRGGLVVRGDVVRVLERDPVELGGPFAACLVDPPYDAPLLPPVLERLGRREAAWLTDDALVVAKHFWRTPPPAVAGELAHFRDRRFGETMLTFYRWREAGGSSSAEAT